MVDPHDEDLGIYNFSSYELTAKEATILSLGLSFLFAPPSDPHFACEIEEEAMRYHNKVRWQCAQLHSEDTAPPDPATKIRPKESTPGPRPTPPVTLYLSSVWQKLADFFATYTPPREDKFEPLIGLPFTAEDAKRTLERLRKHTNPELVFNKADKNSAITIMDKEDYIRMCLVHLEDPSTYERLDELPDSRPIYLQLRELLLTHIDKGAPMLRDKRVVAKLLEAVPHLHHRGVIPRGFLVLELPPYPMYPSIIPAKFYILVKTHKCPIASRPIAGCNETITNPVSVFLDAYLQPILRQVPTFVASSMDVVRTLETHTFPEGSVIMCLDVDALYPSIPIALGAEYVRRYLIFKGMDGHDAALIHDLFLWVLNNNYLAFGDRYYRQIKGTAMGTSCAVVFATLFMAYLEEVLLHRVERPLSPRGGAPPGFRYTIDPLLNFRYIDDLLIIHRNVLDAEYHRDCLNALCPAIRLTGTITADGGAFLDLWVYKGERFRASGRMDTRIYQKATNKYLYLCPATYHPRHVLTGMITAELERYRSRCTNLPDFFAIRKLFYSRLRLRHYQPAFLAPLFARLPDRQALLAGKPKYNAARRPVFVVPLGPDTNATPLKELLSPHPAMTSSVEVDRMFANTGPLIAYRNPPDLRSMLVRARVQPPLGTLRLEEALASPEPLPLGGQG